MLLKIMLNLGMSNFYLRSDAPGSKGLGFFFIVTITYKKYLTTNQTLKWQVHVVASKYELCKRTAAREAMTIN